MHLANSRRNKAEETTDDDIPSTSGRQFVEAAFPDSSNSVVSKVVLLGALVLLRSYLHYIILLVWYFMNQLASWFFNVCLQ
jgi:hypothetical protein